MNTIDKVESSTATEKKEFDFTKYLPIVTAGLIFLGVSRLLFYYSFFGISILPFLEFGEIITSFLDIIFVYAMALWTMWLFFLIKPNWLMKTTRIELIKNQSLKKVMFMSMMLVILITMLVFIPKPLRVVCAIIIIPSSVYLIVFKKSNSRMIKSLSLLSIIFIYLEVMTIYLTVESYWEVKNEKKYIGTKIVFNNDTTLEDSSHIFISDSTDFYIGQTNKYIFIHHLRKGITSVYPVSNVVRIDLKTKHTGGKLKQLID